MFTDNHRSSLETSLSNANALARLMLKQTEIVTRFRKIVYNYEHVSVYWYCNTMDEIRMKESGLGAGG